MTVSVFVLTMMQEEIEMKNEKRVQHDWKSVLQSVLPLLTPIVRIPAAISLKIAVKVQCNAARLKNFVLIR